MIIFSKLGHGGTLTWVSDVQEADIFFFSSRRRHTRFDCDWSSDVCSSDLAACPAVWICRYHGAQASAKKSGRCQKGGRRSKPGEIFFSSRHEPRDTYATECNIGQSGNTGKKLHVRRAANQARHHIIFIPFSFDPAE